MKRRLFTIISATSLLLLVGTLGAWFMARDDQPLISLRSRGSASGATGKPISNWRVELDASGIVITRYAALEKPWRVPSDSIDEWLKRMGIALGIPMTERRMRGRELDSIDAFYGQYSKRGILGFAFESGLPDLIVRHDWTQSPPVWRSTECFGFWSHTTIPYWPLMVVFAVLPGISVWRITRRLRMLHRILHDRCAICGYDLRASKERCPECGTRIPEWARKEVAA
jgi:hypothetical protein